MSKWKCTLIEKALNDPNWNVELNAELCEGDCNNCPHAIIEKNKLEEVVSALYDHFEEKRIKEAKLEFMKYIMNIALEKTNQELEKDNLLDFIKLLQEKDHYQEEFKEATRIFEDNLFEIMEKIIHDTIKAIKET